MEQSYGIRTLLMTDVVGSTRLWAAHPDAMPDAMRRMEALASSAFEPEGGRVLKARGEGDSLFCVFPTPASAARGARAFVVALQTEPWPEGITVKVRAAIHCGPAHERDGDLYGPTPNRCARLREVGHGGQILLSAAARAQIQTSDGLDLRDLGRHRLRDLDESETVYQIVGEGLPQSFPPLRSLTCLRNNLPAQFTRFVGRDELRSSLLRRIEDDRLTTLTGAGGCGKTRLALQVGADTIDRFPDGVWLVELADVATEAGIVPAFAAACGHRDLDDSAGIDALAHRLLNREAALLIVDNAEHVLASTARAIASLLKALSGIRILVTSREPLRLRGERVHRVPPLSTPPVGCDDPFVVAESEAGRLFIDRATLRLPEFELRPSNARAVCDIVRRLDGIPLGLEMAAAHVGYLSAEQIAARLHDRFAFLEGEDESAPPRHRTMRETIAWQVDMLDPQDRTLFQRLAVFAGNFTLDAAEVVGGGPPLSPDTVMGRLRALVDKSLVVAVSGGTETRYRFLETIGQYAAESGEAEIAAALPFLFDWTHRVSGECYAGMYGPDHARCVDLLDTAEASMRRALEWAFISNDPRAPELARNLTRYWHFRARFGEGYAVLGRAARHCKDPVLLSELDNATAVFASRLGDQVAAERAYRDVLARSGVRAVVHARVATNLGILLNERGDLEGANAMYVEAMRLAVSAGDETLQRLIGYNQALALTDGGELERARACLETAKEGYEQVADQGRVALCLESLASIRVLQDDPLGAAILLRDAFRAVGSQPDAQFVADALLDAAWVAARTGHIEEATALLSAHRTKQKSTRSPTVRRNLRKIEVVEAVLKAQGPLPANARPGDWGDEESLLELARQTALRTMETLVESEPRRQPV